MPTVNSKNRRGTALLEAIIAIGVILVGVVGSLVLLNTSINLGRANQDRIVGQNLAREGLELAYSLRNSGSMRSVDKPTVDWFDFLHKEVLKTNDPVTYLATYNLGDLESGVCKQRCVVGDTDANCTTENDDQVNDNGALVSQDNGDANDEAERLCDLDAIENAFTKLGWRLPPACNGDATTKSLLGTTSTPEGCDYNSSGSVDISDISLLHNYFYKQSFQFGYGFPTFASAIGQATASLDFFTSFTNFDATSGTYISLDTIWSDARAQMFTDSTDTVYLQNVTLPNAKPSKFYRVVSVQQICRGTLITGETVELVVEPTSALNCEDFVAANDGAGELAEGWNAASVPVGALVTSEVRWPTPTSSTKVRYQEYLYDWLAL